MAAAESKPVRRFAANAVGSLWWYFLLRGLLVFGVGIYVLLRPGMSAVTIAQALGFLALFDGLLAIIAGIMARTPSRLAMIGRGILLALLGIFVFAQPAYVTGIAVTTVLYVVAFFVTLNGLLEIIAALRDKAEPEGEGSSLLEGILSMAFGGLLFFAPLAFGLFIVRILGVAAVLIGVILLFLALKFRKLRNTLRS